MVKEQVSTSRARSMQAQLGLKLLTRTKTLAAYQQGSVSWCQYSRRGSARKRSGAGSELILDATISIFMLFAGHIISSSSYPISNTISPEDERSPLRHRWAAALTQRPTPRGPLGQQTNYVGTIRRVPGPSTSLPITRGHLSPQ